jgi:hypothetical protein
MSRAFVASLAAVLGSALLLLIFELALRLLPIQNGLAAADGSADWPTHHLIADVHYTFSDAWNLRNVRRGVTNNMGYVAPFAYVPGSTGIAVMGNSFIEGLMIDYRDTLQGQLAEEVSGAPEVLNFGVSGASLPDYLGLGGMVSKRFKLQWAVILVVGGDFVNGFRAQAGYFSWNAGNTPPLQLRPEPVRGRMEKFVRSLAIVRYIRGNLRFTLSHFLHTSTKGRRQPCVPESLQPGDAYLIKAYADALPNAYGLPPSRVILVFDSDRAELYRSQGLSTASSCPTRDGVALGALATAAARSGEHVISMGPIFAAYYRATGKRLDYSPIDYHWNDTAHRLAAAEVARLINRATFPQVLVAKGTVTRSDRAPVAKDGTVTETHRTYGLGNSPAREP